eukprot:COSAG06_NODE_4348_length_4348_cov_1.633325_2_plen_44_part_00
MIFDVFNHLKTFLYLLCQRQAGAAEANVAERVEDIEERHGVYP